MRNLFIYTIFLFAWLLQPLHAQDATFRPIEEEKWEKAVDGKDYTEDVEEEVVEEMTLPEEKQPFSVSAEWLKILVFTAIAALLIFILIRIFGKGLFGNPKVATGQAIEVNDLDEKPMESDLERFLREAIEARNYRLAVRIYYLMLLRSLQDRELISWKKNKTNFDYLLEVANHPNFHQLNNSTLIYEYVWYGEQAIAEPQFNSIKLSFNDLIQKIGEK